MAVTFMHLAGRVLALMLIQAPAAGVPVPAPGASEDPRVRALVEQFFAAQESEDVDAYLALWSAKARKPRSEQLAFVFDAGDDKFLDLVVDRVTDIGDLRRVTVSVTRERTDSTPGPGGTKRVSRARRAWSLTLVVEGEALKILSEGFPADDLAAALVAAPSADAREALMAAEPEALTDRLIDAVAGRANSLAATQQYTAARAIYDVVLETARRIGNRRAEGEALQNIANSYYFQNDHPSALNYYEQRLALERNTDNAAGAASALLGIATVKYSTFHYSDALAAYREALALFTALQDDAGMATALLSSGNVLYLQGDLGGAIDAYRRSRALYRAAHNTDGEARALDGLGRVYVSQGDYAGALDAFAGVWEEGRARGNRIMQANARHSTGEVHLRLGNAGAARAAFDESRQHFEAAADPASVGTSWQGTALAELLDARFVQAEQAYQKSMDACASAQEPECIARAIVGLAYAQFSQGHHDAAIASYVKAVAAFTALEQPEGIGRAEVGLSQALFGKKDYAAASRSAASAADRSPVMDVIWRAHLAEARARRALGETDAAVAGARAAVEVVEAMAREALEQPSPHLAADTASVYAFLAVLRAEAGDHVGAFDLVERRHAHVLRLALSTSERDIYRHMTPEERDAEREAANRVGSLQAQITREKGLPRPDATRIAALAQALADAAEARATGRARLLERWPDLRTWRGLAPPVTALDVVAFVLGEETMVVQFVIDQDDLLVVSAAPAGEDALRFTASLSPVSRQSLAEIVATATTPASLQDAAQWRKAVTPLVEAIPSGVRAGLASARRALLVPDGVLWRVPFEALPAGAGYLAESVEISYAPSMTTLLRPREAAPSFAADGQSPTRLLAAAAPVMSATRVDALMSTAPDWRLRDTGSAEREAATVAAAVTEPAPLVLIGAEATEAAFRAAAVSARILHVGSPFRVSSASPLFSRLIWTVPGPSRPSADADVVPPVLDSHDDGVLEAREVMNLDLRAEMVVLSDGAATSMRDAAAAIGPVRWAWRAAGIPALTLRRWADGHGSANALLADYVARVNGGEPPAGALRAARAPILHDEQTRAPWFWASWIVVR
jgi:tetratricopeptide (TPR) repeat protein